MSKVRRRRLLGGMGAAGLAAYAIYEPYLFSVREIDVPVSAYSLASSRLICRGQVSRKTRAKKTMIQRVAWAKEPEFWTGLRG